jgi:hypothetical protein
MNKLPQDPNKKPKRLVNYAQLSIVLLAIIGVGVWFLYQYDSPEIPGEAVETGNSGERKILDSKKYDFSFSENRFDTGEELSLLKEIEICDTSMVKDAMGACSPKFFKFFPLSNNKPLRDGFILIVNGILYPKEPGVKFNLRRTLIYERSGGKLELVNLFKGNLIEQRRIAGLDHDDIILRFRIDKHDEAYHVLYTWNNNRYKFQRCEELFSPLNKGKVRKEMIDSVSREVEKILLEEKLVR